MFFTTARLCPDLPLPADLFPRHSHATHQISVWHRIKV